MKGMIEINNRWLIFCEESGDKGIPWRSGSSHYYIVSAILVKESDEQSLINVIEREKYRILRMSAPLEWKNLKPRQKTDDKILRRFLKKIQEDSPPFLISTVICNKHETTGPGFFDRNTYMNYLYGLMFKRIAWFLKKTHSTATLIIDRNTDKIAQESLHSYLSSISRSQTGEHPRFSKPKWLNPEEHPLLGLADFTAGLSLRALTFYQEHNESICRNCIHLQPSCIFTCPSINFLYTSYQQVVDLNYHTLPNWDWKGLIYHPFESKDKHLSLFSPK